MRIITPFTASSTAMDVIAGVDFTGRAVIVTGASSGIGVETARALAAAGAHVTLAVRDLDAGRRTADDIAATTGNGLVAVRGLDLTDLDSIAAFAAGWNGPLHALIHNAGVMETPRKYTRYGWELQFATNHLGHFALTLALHDALAEAATTTGEARVVAVSSSGHGSSPVRFDDLFFRRRPYDAGHAYGQSKTAQILFAVEATRRWARHGITTNALMPGGIWTNLQRHWDPDRRARLKAAVPGKTPQQGAATSVLLAASPRLQGVSGRYFDDCAEAEPVEEIVEGLHGVRAWALDKDAARRLWDVSLALIDAARR
ncbi:SDR family NAD(P)-dependent oxidoreductase [Streptomyces sp. NBC_00243]|uniref:SDR family NAD(P)-dependent oxidoreductase n=1 Tax=Streptomyces sp. NBC_00243 TaxID=2975688 RepID=UPI002DD90961|nr:SDR family NAD(P)-dependent oxidoreductase [Streptomyces sp. NBC_00243]WRZ18701.1 SDR family NAD(P)-dependent oxidoreductase [Streptomyces sp. NBC_00243]